MSAPNLDNQSLSDNASLVTSRRATLQPIFTGLPSRCPRRVSAFKPLPCLSGFQLSPQQIARDGKPYRFVQAYVVTDDSGTPTVVAQAHGVPMPPCFQFLERLDRGPQATVAAALQDIVDHSKGHCLGSWCEDHRASLPPSRYDEPPPAFEPSSFSRGYIALDFRSDGRPSMVMPNMSLPLPPCVIRIRANHLAGLCKTICQSDFLCTFRAAQLHDSMEPGKCCMEDDQEIVKTPVTAFFSPQPRGAIAVSDLTNSFADLMSDGSDGRPTEAGDTVLGETDPPTETADTSNADDVGDVVDAVDVDATDYSDTAPNASADDDFTADRPEGDEIGAGRPSPTDDTPAAADEGLLNGFTDAGDSVPGDSDCGATDQAERQTSRDDCPDPASDDPLATPAHRYVLSFSAVVEMRKCIDEQRRLEHSLADAKRELQYVMAQQFVRLVGLPEEGMEASLLNLLEP